MAENGEMCGPWRRFLENPRALVSAILLGVIFLASLVTGFFLPPPSKVLTPGEVEPFRRAILRIVPKQRSGRLDVSPDLSIVSQIGCEDFSPALVSGARLDAILRLPAPALDAISNRLANVASPAATFPVELPDGSGAEIVLAAFSPRQALPRTVRLRLRDPDASVKPISCVLDPLKHPGIMDALGSLDAKDLPSLQASLESLGLPQQAGLHGDMMKTLENREISVSFSLEAAAWPFRPVPGHPCGIDSAGRDVLSRIVAGTRIALLFGLLLVASSMLIGIAAGAVQGYFGGVVDIAAQRFIEIWSSLPFLYVMMLVGSVFGRNFGLLLFCYGLFNWIGLSYYMRAEFLRLRSRPFVEAARCQGFSTWNIMVRHILPNALTPVITLLPFSLIGAISSISALDFLGFGLPPLTPSLGELLRQAQQNTHAWWLILYPSIALFSMMLLAVFIGEGLRDAFDPKPAARYE